MFKRAQVGTFYALVYFMAGFFPFPGAQLQGYVLTTRATRPTCTAYKNNISNLLYSIVHQHINFIPKQNNDWPINCEGVDTFYWFGTISELTLNDLFNEIF